MPDNIEREVGYLKAKVEEQKTDLVRVEQKIDILTDVVRKKFTTAETVFNVIKFVGIAAVAIITFKFGDIKEWWNFLFKN